MIIHVKKWGKLLMNEGLTDFSQKFSAILTDSLNSIDHAVHTEVDSAMKYSLIETGGKRLRPFILLSITDHFSIERSISSHAAVALEMIHCYSLIHDDLPAMDDDILRRGMACCHIKYGEAIAILAGDALLTHAFEILSRTDFSCSAEKKCALITSLTKAAGKNNMIAGQALDISIDSTQPKSYEEIIKIQNLKSSALFAAACEMAAILSDCEQETTQALKAFAYKFGNAFQIIDDIDDISNDRNLDECNIVKVIGIEKAKETVILLLKEADKILKENNISIANLEMLLYMMNNALPMSKNDA